MREYAVGEHVSLQITGMIGTYEGEITGFDKNGHPLIRVEEEGPFAKLRYEDYIILREKHP